MILYADIGSDQFGSTVGSVGNNQNYTFSSVTYAPMLAPGNKITVDIYADALASDQVGSSDATSFVNCGANVYSCSPATGQTITITAGGLLPVQISQPASGTQWTIGKTYPIQWLAWSPWGTGDDQGTFALQLFRNGSGTNIAFGPPGQFVNSKGSSYSQFGYSYSVPSNLPTGTYSLVILQNIGSIGTSTSQSIFID